MFLVNGVQLVEGLVVCFGPRLNLGEGSELGQDGVGA